MSIHLFVSISTLAPFSGIHMTMTPMQPLEQSTGFIFDSMDFAMSRSSACQIQTCPNTPTMEDWDDEDDEEVEDGSEDQVGKEEIAVEIDKDLHDDDEDEDQSADDAEENEVYSDDDDDFEQYLHGDDDD